MRVSTSHLQQLAIFTTVLTGVGVTTMYLLLQKRFSTSDWHRLALQRLNSSPSALESLGVPPLKVHNVRLTDRHNRINQETAQMKIPVSGSKTGGYLYTTAVRESHSWRLEQAVLNLREGQTIDLMDPLISDGPLMDP